MNPQRIKSAVKAKYGKLAVSGSCCEKEATSFSGHSRSQFQKIPQTANLGLGCGTPVERAELKPGMKVLDLGAGAGWDAFLASRYVGPKGKVIGVDMTPEMVARAEKNRAPGNFGNVEFRLAEIEKLPFADRTFDVVISNCVINLSPHKRKVFQEAFRVLKPGGRLVISDIVAIQPLPHSLKNSIESYTGCIAGAALKNEYLKEIKAAGFEKIRILEELQYPESSPKTCCTEKKSKTELSNYVESITIQADKRR